MRVRVALLAATAVVALSLPAAAQRRETLSGAYLAGSVAAARGDAPVAARYFGSAMLRDPENAMLAEQAMVHQLMAGMATEAERSAERLVRLAPLDRTANLVLAARDMRRGGHAAVRTRIAEAGDGFHPLTAAVLDAWAAQGTGDTAAALAALEPLGDSGLFGAFAGYHRGLLLTLHGDLDGALAALTAVRTGIGARSARMIEAEAIVLDRLDREDEARALLDEFAGEPSLDAAGARLGGPEPLAPLVETPEQGAAEAMLALAGLMTGEQDRRSGLLHARLAVHLRPDLDAAKIMVAGMLTGQEQHEQAAAVLRSVAEDSPLALRARIGEAEALQALEQTDTARTLLETLRDAHPDEATVHIALGDLLRRNEVWEPCAAAYGTAVDLLMPQQRVGWPLLYQRGICFERAGVWDRAEADFKAALEKEPDQPLVLNYLGYSWVEQGHRLDEAKVMIEKAVEQRPDDGYITDSLGWVLYRMGDFPGAVEWLERAVELAPTDPVINDHLGDALWQVGRRHEARFQWKRARSFDPEDKDLARIRRKLEVGLDAVLAEERAATPAAAQALPPAAAPNPVPNGG